MGSTATYLWWLPNNSWAQVSFLSSRSRFFNHVHSSHSALQTLYILCAPVAVYHILLCSENAIVVHLLVQARHQGAIRIPPNPHPTAHQSISFQWISLMLILTLPRHFPCNYLNWDSIISCTDYCLSLLLCLPCWGTILLNNANLPMPLSFKILLWFSTASGRNLKSL